MTPAGNGAAGRPVGFDPAAAGAGAVRSAGAAPAGRREAAQAGGAPGAFQALLRQKVAAQGLRWSRHAEDRLRQAGITLDEADREAIDRAVNALAGKGAREGLIVYGDLALVVSVRGRTVITAARPERLDEGVFTQIDAAAIINRNPGAGPQRAADGAGGAPSPWNDGSGLTFRRSIVS
ncbi:MAG: hypothetical protein FWJ62_00205 [Thermaerobacter sp.]|nr:hypothetical protein [Bacillota bacterium]